MATDWHRLHLKHENIKIKYNKSHNDVIFLT